MRIFLTGATGFLGGQLIQRLVQQNHDVILLARNIEKANNVVNALPIEHQQQVEVVQGDITSPVCGMTEEFINANIGKVDVVYHSAALVKFDQDLRQELYDINFKGTQHTLELARRLQVKKFFHVSTAYTVGQGSEGKEGLYPTNQSFHNPYEETKVLAEHEVMKHKEEMDVSIFRPAIIVGDSKTGKADSTFTLYGFLRTLYVFKRKASRRGPLNGKYRIIGGFNGTENFVPVDYVADILALGVEKAENGKVYHITNPNPPTNRELLEKAREILDFPTLDIIEPDEVAEGDLGVSEKQLNGMLTVLSPYFVTDKVFCDKNTQGLIEDTEVKHLCMDDEMINRIFKAAL